MSVRIYGIKNCDTVRKAFKWLEARDIEYTIHDYKKDGIDEAVLLEAFDKHGWENVINRKSTTWRKLPEKVRNAMNEKSAIQAAHDNPSIVKRPIAKKGKKFLLGFKEESYEDFF